MNRLRGGDEVCTARFAHSFLFTPSPLRSLFIGQYFIEIFTIELNLDKNFPQWHDLMANLEMIVCNGEWVVFVSLLLLLSDMTRKVLLVFAGSPALAGGCSPGGRVLPLSLGSLLRTRSRRPLQPPKHPSKFFLRFYLFLMKKGHIQYRKWKKTFILLLVCPWSPLYTAKINQVP